MESITITPNPQLQILMFISSLYRFIFMSQYGLTLFRLNSFCLYAVYTDTTIAVAEMITEQIYVKAISRSLYVYKYWKAEANLIFGMLTTRIYAASSKITTSSMQAALFLKGFHLFCVSLLDTSFGLYSVFCFFPVNVLCLYLYTIFLML